MKCAIGVLGVLLLCQDGIAQPFHVQPANAFISAGAYSSHFTDAFSFKSNPASLGVMSNTLFGTLTERKWMLAALSNYELSASFSLGNGGVGATLHHSGDTDFSEQGIELAYGIPLGRMELGLGMSYLRNQAAGYGHADFISSGIGMRFHATDHLITGWELGLPVSGVVGKTNPERGSRFFRMGFGYECNEDLLLVLQIEKESGQPLSITGSMEYRYADQFYFSFGVRNNDGSAYGKAGWKKNRICIQIYTGYAYALGFSPGLLLLLETKSKKE